MVRHILKVYLFSFLFLTLSFAGLAQKLDLSVDLALAKSYETKITKGLKWKTYVFDQKNIFDSNQNINLIEVKNETRKLKFGLASADSASKHSHISGVLKPTSQIAMQNGALAAVNAGFFDMQNGGAVDYIKIKGQVYDTSRVFAKQRLPFKQTISAFTIKNNKVKIIKGEQDKGWEDKLNAEFVLLTGPLLLENSIPQKLAKTAFNDNRHPRTCAYVTNSDKLLVLTVDGRAAQSEGMTLGELTQLLKSLNCKDAINFDGGGSTTMYLKGKPENGVVNFPTDNKKYDHQGERSVSNIFYIK